MSKVGNDNRFRSARICVRTGAVPLGFGFLLQLTHRSRRGLTNSARVADCTRDILTNGACDIEFMKLLASSVLNGIAGGRETPAAT